MKKVLFWLYIISIPIFIIWTYLDGTLNKFKWWEVPFATYVVFFWLLFLLAVTGLFPKTKDNM